MSRYIPDKIRERVWQRDGGRCVICGSKKDIEYDHIIPYSKGGSNSMGNIQLLCKRHNQIKTDFINAGFTLNRDYPKEGYILKELSDELKIELDDLIKEQSTANFNHIIDLRFQKYVKKRQEQLYVFDTIIERIFNIKMLEEMKK